MDPAKLKVVELRSELAALGLDTKGNKAVLVERLKKAIENETGGVVPDTTIADTSTEEVEEDPEPSRSARRPGPASRTRRRLSSSEPVPATPTRSARREPAPTIPEQPTTVDSDSDSQECILSDDLPRIGAPSSAPVKEAPKPTPPVQEVPKPAPVVQQPPKPAAEPPKPVKPLPAPAVSPAKPQPAPAVSPAKPQPAPVVSPAKPQPAPVVSPAKPAAVASPAKPAVASPAKPVTPAPVQVSPKPVQMSPKPVVPVTPPKPVEAAKPAVQVSPKPAAVSPVKVAPEQQSKPVVGVPSVAQTPQQSSPVKPTEALQKSPAKPTAVQQSPAKPQEGADQLKNEEQLKPAEAMEGIVDGKPEEDKKAESAEGEDVDMDKTANLPKDGEARQDLDKSREDADKKNEKDRTKEKERRRRDKQSRWGSESLTIEFDAVMAEETKAIREATEGHRGSRDRSSSVHKRARSPSPRRMSPHRAPEPEMPPDTVCLSYYDSDLSLQLDVPTMTTATPLAGEAFDYCWAGARSSHGVKAGKVCYEVKVEGMKESSAEGKGPAIRLGWSTSDSSLHLGEGDLSWGFESTGRKVNKSEFAEYGSKIVENDIVGVYLDLDSSPCTITYTVNGVSQDAAFEFDKEEVLGEAAVYAHILTRQCKYRVNFGASQYTLMTKTKPVQKMMEVAVEVILEERKAKELLLWKEKEAKLLKEKEENRRRSRQRDRDRSRNDSWGQKNRDKEAEDKSKAAKPAQENGEVAAPKAGDKGAEKYDPMEVNDEDDKEDTKAQVEKPEPKEEEEVKAAEEEQKEVKAEEVKPDNGAPEEKPKEEKVEEKKEEPMEVAEEQQPDLKVDQSDIVESRPGFTMREVTEIEADGEVATMLEGYIFISKVPLEELVAGPRKPAADEQAQVIMMCGLPGAGKTYWALNHIKENPDKRFNILGTNTIIEMMKVDCKPFKSQYEGPWIQFLPNITSCVVKLIEQAQRRRRNYIIDQTNVYQSAQRRKMREFTDNYKRSAIIVIPDEAVYSERQQEREKKEGKDMPDDGILELKASFVLPEQCSWLEEVIYTDLGEEEAKKLLVKYNKEGQAAGYGGAGGRGSGGMGGGGSRGYQGGQGPPKRPRYDSHERRVDRGGGRPPHRPDRRDDRRGGWDRNSSGGGGGRGDWARGGGGRGGDWGGSGGPRGGGGGWGSRDQPPPPPSHMARHQPPAFRERPQPWGSHRGGPGGGGRGGEGGGGRGGSRDPRSQDRRPNMERGPPAQDKPWQNNRQVEVVVLPQCEEAGAPGGVGGPRGEAGRAGSKGEAAGAEEEVAGGSSSGGSSSSSSGGSSRRGTQGTGITGTTGTQWAGRRPGSRRREAGSSSSPGGAGASTREPPAPRPHPPPSSSSGRGSGRSQATGSRGSSGPCRASLLARLPWLAREPRPALRPRPRTLPLSRCGRSTPSSTCSSRVTAVWLTTRPPTQLLHLPSKVVH